MSLPCRRIAAFLLLAATLLLPAPAVAGGLAPAGDAAHADVPLGALPPEARQTLVLIERGGPFPYARDGAVFRNFEKRLPPRERGYYREYTVKTPGLTQRGARRIVTGHGGERYYTDDHYRTFRRIQE